MSVDRPRPEFASVESLLVAAGRDGRPGLPLNVPLVPASNFGLGAERAYSRDHGTPTWEALEEIVGLLDGGLAVAFASGMAGVAAIFDQLRAGSRVVLPDDCYQGVVGLAELGQRIWRRRCARHRPAGEAGACWRPIRAYAEMVNRQGLALLVLRPGSNNRHALSTLPV